ncbi:hypothetical protein GDO86_015552 [Hymenochirus boettgeri]|uniref:Exonuclease 1 n=1 Tax=Hymenochirus boettgeri TaxID=247094 RepID=A0A8T2JVX9_9PIPI|nr:hypothetical protein GDO86_015552 [Hymenochirus boettgeri]
MDKFGNGLEIDQERLGKCKSLGDVFTEEKFRYMCILSGCDYLPSIHGIGLAKACKLLKIANNPDITKVIKKIGQYLKTNITVPDGYIEGFLRANNTFLYQLVFDPVERKLIPLNPYIDDIDPAELSYAGPNIGDSAAFQIALGNLDINTLEQIDTYDPDNLQLSHNRTQSWNDNHNSSSVWHTKSVTCESKKLEEKNSTRGLIFPSKKYTVKRPYEDQFSDTDLLSQYSSSKSKKARPDISTSLQYIPSGALLQSLDDSAISKEPNLQNKTRNKFATFLQRQNEDLRSIPVTGTRSRFFYKPENKCTSDLMDDASKFVKTEEIILNSDLRETKNKSNENNKEHSITEKEDNALISDECKQNSAGVSLPQNQKSCFSWTKTSPTESSTAPLFHSLQKYQRTVPYIQHDMESISLNTCSFSESNTLQNSSNEKSIKEEDMEDSEESGSTPQSPSRVTMKYSPIDQSVFSVMNSLASKSKVSGLIKSQPLVSGLKTKLKPRAPAKVSGLTNRRHIKTAGNNENNPGLQVTIGDLWKNFSFKKH